MSYESAPSTIMLATNCACCGRPLRDSVSVERGVGPDCAKKYSYSDAQTEPNWFAASIAVTAAGLHQESIGGWLSDAHRASNVLIHRVACIQGSSGPQLSYLVAAVHNLGYRTLAEILADRAGAVRVSHETVGDTKVLVVEARYDPRFTDALRLVPGRRWNQERKANVFPNGSREALWAAIKASYPKGTIVVGQGRVAVL